MAPLGSVSDDLIAISSKAFIICDTDGQEGLTWNEARVCEVKLTLIASM